MLASSNATRSKCTGPTVNLCVKLCARAVFSGCSTAVECWYVHTCARCYCRMRTLYSCRMMRVFCNCSACFRRATALASWPAKDSQHPRLMHTKAGLDSDLSPISSAFASNSSRGPGCCREIECCALKTSVPPTWPNETSAGSAAPLEGHRWPDMQHKTRLSYHPAYAPSQKRACTPRHVASTTSLTSASCRQ